MPLFAVALPPSWALWMLRCLRLPCAPSICHCITISTMEASACACLRQAWADRHAAYRACCYDMFSVIRGLGTFRGFPPRAERWDLLLWLLLLLLLLLLRPRSAGLPGGKKLSTPPKAGPPGVRNLRTTCAAGSTEPAGPVMNGRLRRFFFSF